MTSRIAACRLSRRVLKPKPSWPPSGVRPSACAAYHSLSRARCEHAFRHPADIGTPRNARPALLELQAFGSAQIETTSAARKAAGLSGGQLELHQALRALLDGGVLR